MLLRLLLLLCAPLCEPTVSLELFLTASPSHPVEGNPVTLTCKIQPPPQKSDVQLQFLFFRNGQTLGSGWSTSPELQIATVRREDSGYYWCETQTLKPIASWRTQINVQRVPVSDVNLKTKPPEGQVMEGDKLVLICSVANGTGSITFFWYKGTLGLNLATKNQRSLTAEFEIPAVQENDTESYYCAADNGYGPSPSGLVSVTVRVPVSQPILTLTAPRVQAMVGDVVELHCEAFRGSPPILYQFYHEDVTLGHRLAPSGGRASFNLSLTAEHSGSYSCEANNGVGDQHSEVVTLNITVPIQDRGNLQDRRDRLTSGVIEGMLCALGAAMMTLILCYWLKRKIGRRPPRNPPRSPPRSVPQEPKYLNSPSPVQPKPVYENVNVVHGDDIYSLVYHIQQEQESAAVGPPRTHVENKVPSDIYSRLKKANDTDVDYEDAM
ncbi:Fc receptor-like protein 1 isoform X1 [Tupaia chinensis]|uniref:Fc receptor-like protein 1 isoform X1 n=1 Tax=Tupaia chinensis TaxID=246437 RepID=UPI000FFB9EDB|nr:Fc receptor-like protein 1 isoform X1 [Tupaia chinensis]